MTPDNQLLQLLCFVGQNPESAASRSLILTQERRSINSATQTTRAKSFNHLGDNVQLPSDEHANTNGKAGLLKPIRDSSPDITHRLV